MIVKETLEMKIALNKQEMYEYYIFQILDRSRKHGLGGHCEGPPR